MSQENVEAIRELFDRFGEIEFERLREALETSSSLVEAAPKMGDLGRWHLDHLDPKVELDASAMPTFTEGNRAHGHQGWFEFWRSWLIPWERSSTSRSVGAMPAIASSWSPFSGVGLRAALSTPPRSTTSGPLTASELFACRCSSPGKRPSKPPGCRSRRCRRRTSSGRNAPLTPLTGATWLRFSRWWIQEWISRRVSSNGAAPTRV